MEEEIKRTIEKLVEMKWITINEKLNPDAVTSAFIDILKDMSLKKFVDIFTPKGF